MIRTSACIGLYPDVADPQARTSDAPRSRPYKTGGAQSGLCYLTEVVVDAAVIGIARLAGNESRVIPLRWIGYAKLALLAMTALAVAFALHRAPGAALLHGLLVAAILADPVATLWFNSLYTEFAAIWGLYAMIAAACALALTERGALRDGGDSSRSHRLACVFARAVHAPSCRPWWSCAAPWLWRRSAEMTGREPAPRTRGVPRVEHRRAAPGGRHACESRRHLSRPGASRPAGRSARWRCSALPGCEAMIGATWYLQRGENLQQACPEVFSLSSSRSFASSARAPRGQRAPWRARSGDAGTLPGYLGTLEGQPRTAATCRGPGFRPSTRWRNACPGKVFVALVLAAILAAPLAGLAAIAWARPSRDDPCAGLLLAMLLGGTVLYGVLTTVFGDGLSEAARHFLPGALALYSLVLVVIGVVPSLTARWIAAPKARAFEMALALAAVPIVFLSCAGALRWAQAQPLALGVVDAPAGREAVPSGLALRGWALDPTGVESVQVEIGALKREATIGIASPALREALPGYPDAAQGNFALDLGADDLARAGAPQPLPLRITARGRGGAVTEIDRRRLEFPSHERSARPHAMARRRGDPCRRDGGSFGVALHAPPRRLLRLRRLRAAHAVSPLGGPGPPRRRARREVLVRPGRGRQPLLPAALLPLVRDELLGERNRCPALDDGECGDPRAERRDGGHDRRARRGRESDRAHRRRGHARRGTLPLSRAGREVVAWISGRFDGSATFFTLLACVFFQEAGGWATRTRGCRFSRPSPRCCARNPRRSCRSRSSSSRACATTRSIAPRPSRAGSRRRATRRRGSCSRRPTSRGAMRCSGRRRASIPTRSRCADMLSRVLVRKSSCASGMARRAVPAAYRYPFLCVLALAAARDHRLRASARAPRARGALRRRRDDRAHPRVAAAPRRKAPRGRAERAAPLPDERVLRSARGDRAAPCAPLSPSGACRLRSYPARGVRAPCARALGNRAPADARARSRHRALSREPRPGGFRSRPHAPGHRRHSLRQERAGRVDAAADVCAALELQAPRAAVRRDPGARGQGPRRRRLDAAPRDGVRFPRREARDDLAAGISDARRVLELEA